MNAIYAHLINADAYYRIKSLNQDITMQFDYEHFIHWHKRILSELSHNELQFLATLCDMFKRRNIHSMDEEHCSEMVCNAFYYTIDYKLVIVTPR